MGGFITALALAGLLLLQHQADREARRNLYAADMILASRALSENNRGRALALLSKYRPTKNGVGAVLEAVEDADQDVRGWEWRFLWHSAQSDELFTLGRHTRNIAGLALAPDGNTLYSASKDRTVGIWSLASRRQTGSLLHGGDLHDLDLSRDGHFLATTDKAHVLRVWNTANQTVSFARTNAGPLGFVRLTPDGHQLIHRDAEGVWVLDRITGSRTALRQYAHEEVRHMSGAAFSQDGSLFAFDAGDSVIRLLDWKSRTEIGVLHYDESVNPQWGILGLALSPDGRRVAAAYSGAWVRWRDLGSPEIHEMQTDHSEFVISLAFSPDGDVLATGSFDPGVRLWRLRDGARLAELSGSLQAYLTVQFSADGRRLAAGSFEGPCLMPGVWSTSTGDPKSNPAPPRASKAFG